MSKRNRKALRHKIRTQKQEVKDLKELLDESGPEDRPLIKGWLQSAKTYLMLLEEEYYG